MGERHHLFLIKKYASMTKFKMVFSFIDLLRGLELINHLFRKYFKYLNLHTVTLQLRNFQSR